MSERANYFKIGLFVIVAVGLLTAGVIILGIGTFFREEVKVETYFQDSVQGLDIGSPVKFRGVQIGQVEEMTLVRKEYDTRHRYVLVRMALLSEAFMSDKEKITREIVEREVEQGLRVRLGFQGVTGAAYIEADYLDPLRFQPLAIDWRPKHPYIPAGPSLITRISDAVDSIMRNLEAINIRGIADSLDQTLRVATRTMEGVDTAEISGQLKQLLVEVRETNRHIDQMVKELEVDPVLKEAAATLARIRKTVEEAEPPLRKLLTDGAAAAGNLRQMTTGQQQEIQAAIENLRQITENLRAASEDIRQNPSQVLFGEPPPRRFPGGGK